MTVGSLAIGILSTFTLTSSYLALLLFTLFAILGGLALGALNSRKAKQQAKYKNEYTAYAGMFFAAIISLGVYYLFFAIEKVDAAINTGIDLTGAEVIYISMAGALMGIFGIGLTVANSLVE